MRGLNLEVRQAVSAEEDKRERKKLLRRVLF